MKRARSEPEQHDGAAPKVVRRGHCAEGPHEAEVQSRSLLEVQQEEAVQQWTRCEDLCDKAFSPSEDQQAGPATSTTSLLGPLVMLQAESARWWTAVTARANFFLSDEDLVKLRGVRNVELDGELIQGRAQQLLNQSDGVEGPLYPEWALLEMATYKHGRPGFLRLRLLAEEAEAEVLQRVKHAGGDQGGGRESATDIGDGALKARLAASRMEELAEERGIICSMTVGCEEGAGSASETRRKRWTLPAAMLEFGLAFEDLESVPYETIAPDDAERRVAFYFGRLYAEKGLIAAGDKKHQRRLRPVRESACSKCERLRAVADHVKATFGSGGHLLAKSVVHRLATITEPGETERPVLGLKWLTRQAADALFGVANAELSLLPHVPALDPLSIGPAGDLFNERDLQIFTRSRVGSGILKDEQSRDALDAALEAIVERNTQLYQEAAAEEDSQESVYSWSLDYLGFMLGLKRRAVKRKLQGSIVDGRELYCPSDCLELALQQQDGVIGLLRFRLGSEKLLAAWRDREAVLRDLTFVASDEMKNMEQESDGTDAEDLQLMTSGVHPLQPVGCATPRWWTHNTAKENFFLGDDDLNGVVGEDTRTIGGMRVYHEDALRLCGEHMMGGMKAFQAARRKLEHEWEEGICSPIQKTVPLESRAASGVEEDDERGAEKSLVTRLEVLSGLESGDFVSAGVRSGPIVSVQRGARRQAAFSEAVRAMKRESVEEYIRKAQDGQVELRKAVEGGRQLTASGGLVTIVDDQQDGKDNDEERSPRAEDWRLESAAEHGELVPIQAPGGGRATVLCTSVAEKGDRLVCRTMETRDCSVSSVRRGYWMQPDAPPPRPLLLYVRRVPCVKNPKPSEPRVTRSSHVREAARQNVEGWQPPPGLVCSCELGDVEEEEDGRVHDPMAELIVIPEISTADLTGLTARWVEKQVGKVVMSQYIRLHGEAGGWMLREGREAADLVPGPVCLRTHGVLTSSGVLASLSELLSFKSEDEMTCVPGAVRNSKGSIVHDKDARNKQHVVTVHPALVHELQQAVPTPLVVDALTREAAKELATASMASSENRRGLSHCVTKEPDAVAELTASIAECMEASWELSRTLAASEACVSCASQGPHKLPHFREGWLPDVKTHNANQVKRMRQRKYAMGGRRKMAGCTKEACRTRRTCFQCGMCLAVHCLCGVSVGAAPHRVAPEPLSERRLHEVVTREFVNCRSEVVTAGHPLVHFPYKGVRSRPKLHDHLVPHKLHEVPITAIEDRAVDQPVKAIAQETTRELPSKALLFHIKRMAAEKLTGADAGFFARLDESSLVAIGVIVEEAVGAMGDRLVESADDQGRLVGLRDFHLDEAVTTIQAHLPPHATYDKYAVQAVLRTIYGAHNAGRERVVQVMQRLEGDSCSDEEQV